jgi:hypothetical protein
VTISPVRLRFNAQKRLFTDSHSRSTRQLVTGAPGMLDVMKTPAHERRQIEDYLRSQSGDDFEIEHAEKLTSEYVLGQQYDVWDAHTSDGRWWVITNPVNLYSQDQIKSMDIALSFHIGLMSRMMASQPHRPPARTPGCSR